MPIREVPRNYRSVTGKITSRKNGRIVYYESTLERDFFRLQEFDPDVAAYEEQPVRLWIGERQERRPYVPDALVTYCDSRPPLLVEVKYRDELRADWPRIRDEAAAAFRYAKIRGWRFRFRTEREIRTPLLHNASALLPLRWRACDSSRATAIMQYVRTAKNPTFGSVIQAIGDEERTLWVLRSLIARGDIAVDLSVPITTNTRLWINS